ncbi:MAG: hypothetical protein JNJ57_06905 [Saprospiraceae bacterium]|nr:hypothetical protein [Saprospiraceae bacterium]
MNQRTENWILGSILAVFGSYIVLRAFILPITVDEAATAINHVPRLAFDTLFFQKEANPNNHILNTLLIKIFTGIFGWHHFVFRLPVLIGGGLYAWASWKLVLKMSSNSWIRIFSIAMLFGNPYMLEFFSLGRGYGLAAGLMTVALYQAWLFMEKNEARNLRLAFVFAGLSVYANFTLLIFWAPFTFMCLVSAWQLNPSIKTYWTQTKPALKTLAVFVLLWITPLKRLSKDSEILNWNQLGTYFESVQKSVRACIHANAYLGSDSDLVLTWVLLIGMVAGVLVGLKRLWDSKFKLSIEPKAFLVVLLLGVVVTNIVQVRMTHTPYLQSRLALFYWPLYAFTIAASVTWLWERFGKKAAMALMAPLALILTLNTVRTVNLRLSLEWFHDSDTFTVLDYLKNLYLKEGRTEPYLIDTEWFMQNSFMYHLEKNTYGYARYAKIPEFHGNRPPMKEADFFYGISPDKVQEAKTDFDIVFSVPNSSLVLCRHKR